MFLSLLTCASDSDTKCFCFQSGQQDNASHTQNHLLRDTQSWEKCLVYFHCNLHPQKSPWTCHDLLWPSLFIQKATECILWPDVRPPHSAFLSSIHKSPATCADGLLTANKCLSGSLLSDPVPRQGGDWPSFKWHKINEVSSSPDQRSWQAPAQVLFLFPKQHQADEVRLLYQQIQGNPRGDAFPSPIHRGQTPLWVTQALSFLARIDIFV